MTIASTFIASMFFAVSMNVSPLETLLPVAENSTVSAPSRLAAREKLGARSRRVFEEQITDRLAGQDRDLSGTTGGRLFELSGRFQHQVQLVRRQTLQVQQVRPAPGLRNGGKIGAGSRHGNPVGFFRF